MRDKLRKYEAESKKIKKALNKYFGMTISEARSIGWGDREDEIVRLRNAVSQEI